MRRGPPARRRRLIERFLQERQQRDAVGLRRHRRSDRLEHRRHDVDRFGEGRLDRAPAAAVVVGGRVPDDQWDVVRLLEEA